MTSDALALGIVSTLAALLFLLRLFSLRQITAHAWLVDVAFTVFFAYLLRGTLGGMAGAIMAGLTLSLTLHALRIFYAYTDRAKRRAAGHLRTATRTATEYNARAQIAAAYATRTRLKISRAKPSQQADTPRCTD